jgi:hypothetical protein
MKTPPNPYIEPIINKDDRSVVVKSPLLTAAMMDNKTYRTE